MQYTTLGNTDIKVSRICIGGMSFGEVSEGGHQWLLDQDACDAVDLLLSNDDVAYLEELYISHEIVGQITHNGKMY